MRFGPVYLMADKLIDLELGMVTDVTTLDLVDDEAIKCINKIPTESSSQELQLPDIQDGLSTDEDYNIDPNASEGEISISAIMKLEVCNSLSLTNERTNEAEERISIWKQMKQIPTISG